MKVRIPLHLLAYGNLQVLHLKKAVGNALNLRDESIAIFGIFLGKMSDPQELCPECYNVLDYGMDYCFLRLAMNPEEELQVIAADERALELVLWEVKFHYENNVLFPRPRSEIRQNMEYQKQFMHLVMSSGALMSKLTREYLLYRPSYKYDYHSVFINVVRQIPLHYLFYYYVVEACCLKQTTDLNPPVNRGEKIYVVLEPNKCITLDATGQHELSAWTWDDIVIVDPHKRRPPPSYYAATHPDEKPEPTPGILFATTRYMFVHSISRYFQKEYRSRGESAGVLV